jgi:predicted enzyme related to lactoylglutathione lyase
LNPYLGSPRLNATSGLYLHSPALEGLWMEAYRSTLGKLCLRPRIRKPLSFAFTRAHLRRRAASSRRDAMSHAAHHHKINYIEFASTDIEATKKFYSSAFGWNFVDYGPDYISFTAASAGIDGGFYRAGAHEPLPKVAPLIVLYSSDLKAIEDAIVAAGGSVVVPTFEFPGGRRFHFSDGAGNLLAVWSE